MTAKHFGRLTKLARALASQTGGHRFESSGLHEVQKDDGSAASTGLRPTELAVIIGAAAYALILCVFVWYGGADGDLLADDAYYYFQIARNAAAGVGLSFDGISPTNGFHPLYAWLCVPLFRIWPDEPWVPVHMALTGLVISSAATSWVLYRLGRELLSPRVGGLMAFFFLTSPFAWVLPLRGTEEALATLLFVSSALIAARISKNPTFRGSVGLGALLGAAMLARSEYVLWAGPVVLWWLVRTRRPDWALACGATATLVLAPWLAWSWLHFGTIQQVSGAVKLEIDIFGRFPRPAGPVEAVGALALPFIRSAAFVVGEEFSQGPGTLLLALALGAWLVIALVVGGRRRPPVIVALLYGFAVLHLGFYALLMRHYFVWYFLPLTAVMACALAERLARARGRTAAGLAALHLLVGIAAIGAFLSKADLEPRSAERRVAYQSGVLDALPAGTRVGRWNAGAFGYFNGFHHPDLRIVNLDGLVNNPLFAAYQRGEYGDWLLEEVDFLAEDPAYYLPRYLEEGEVDRFVREHTRQRGVRPLLIEIVRR